MGHTQSSGGVQSLDKSLLSEPKIQDNHKSNKNLIIYNNIPTSSYNSREKFLTSKSNFRSSLPPLTKSPAAEGNDTEGSQKHKFNSEQQNTNDYFLYNTSEGKGKSTNFIPDQPRTPSSVTSHDDCDSSGSSNGSHSRSHSSDNNYLSKKDARYYRSLSLPASPFEYSRRQSSYLSHCSLYSETRHEPLKWKKRLDAQRRPSLRIQNNSSPVSEPNNIPYSYKEAMDKICGEKNFLTTYQESESSFRRSDDDFCNSTPNTSVTALSSVNDEITEEISSLNPNLLFGSEALCSLPEAHVLYLIQQDDVGDHSEVDIWKNLIEWGKRNTPKVIFEKDINKWTQKEFESLARTLRNCIYWIRFSQMTPIEFQTYVIPYRSIIPKYILGDFLRQKITDHPPVLRAVAPPRIPTTLIESEIITGRHASILSYWIKNQSYESVEGKPSHRFNLLYRASRDGGTSKDFHLHCDNQGPTILVVKLSDHNMFIGGYNAMSYKDSRRSSISLSKRQSMNKKMEELAQQSCFIYSFENTYYPEQTAIVSRVIPEFKKDAIIRHQWGGPCFGQGDLLVCPDRKNKVLQIHPESYELPIINSNSKNFKWDDFEVFQVIDQ
ncbi:15851_t:CDS:1 [Cetraspora pellucida]|uniref:15851_t:CDS:1 n=1 Tax=Cetraspora pellucida TaxID=1433469 RepID=A0A9N8ZS26_9GLOM|nr:15851_t:CDS:1 [Cetraspora pellucida]